MAKVSWSYSALNAFETCPWRYYLTKVAKQVKDEMGPEAGWGVKAHDALAKRVESGTPLPPEFAGYEPIAASVAGRKGMYLVEQKLALDDKFQPVSWRSSDAWLRSIIDLAILNGPTGAMFDWKTGKRKPDGDQLALFSAVGFAHYPQLQSVSTAFLWLQDKTVERKTFERDKLHETWQHFLPRVRRIEIAVEKNEWPKRPSGLCKKYCPVGKGLCEFWGG